ncbi:MAG: hypothetical protein OXP68_03920 [Anaerolineaceae bacterium]|nr:hypothetical protein [Anaerolineaceae bacterium]MDE0327918.1 hypothetical protein [Anaerolineaceae bacterium]
MSDARPNLIFVLADQLRLQSCGHAGDARADAPHRAFGGGVARLPELRLQQSRVRALR